MVFSKTVLTVFFTGVVAVAQNKVIVANKPAEPVPTSAQGTTQVSGNVNATITGTPKVGVVNLPLTNNGTVANAAVAFKNVDEGARQAINISLQCTVAVAAPTCTASFTVPANKQLVIEYLSMFGEGRNSTLPIWAILTTSAGGTSGQYVVPRGEVTTFSNAYINNLPLRIYADAGSIVTLTGRQDNLTQVGGGSAFFFTLSGHYVDQ
jgi:hypothetical protein